jgi:hypothetical protein
MIPRVIVALMDVYLVPTGPERYELYFEAVDDDAPAAGPSSGVVARMQLKFREVLTAVEREREAVHDAAEPVTLGRRWRRRFVRWMAERIAEQRLLWHLRGQADVSLQAPDCLGPEAAMTTLRRLLQADADRHVRWLAADAVGLLFSLLLVPLPGPNLPGYYFTFRVVGHLFAIRGARHGLRHARWAVVPSAPLSRLADLGQCPPADRAARLSAIESELGLSRFARFFERTAVGSA